MAKKRVRPRRKKMHDTNRRAREFLFAEGFDWIWLKSHEDMRKKNAGDYYYLALDPKPKRCLDPYNLFDGCAYDAEGNFWWIQIKTDNYPEDKPIKAFMVGKVGVNIMGINIRTPKGNRKRYDIKTRTWNN